MNDQLKQTIQRVRAVLEADPAGIVIGELRAGNPGIEIPVGPLAEYYEFLAECDGARCGAIDFWSLDELPGNQFRVGHLPGAGKWLCVGQLLYEPLVINRANGRLWLFRQGPPPDTEGAELGAFGRFLSHDVFGLGYPHLVPHPEADRWCALLGRLALLG